MPYYHTCPDCGANLDPDEKCNCKEKLYEEDFIHVRNEINHHSPRPFGGHQQSCTEATDTSSAGADAAPAANPIQVTGVPTSAVPVAPAPASVPVEQPLSVPTAAPAYTLEMIATAGTALIDAGKMKLLTDLIARYGISSITELDPSQYGAFATELRALGAQI